MSYDVTTYGAVGNGTTDDRAAIQSAIDAAEAAGGGVVYFPQGTYLLGSTRITDFCLTIDNNNVFLVGDGRGISILKLGGSVDGHMINFGVSTTIDVSSGTVVGGGVKNLELNGNHTSYSSPHHNIRTSDNWTDGIIENVFSHHSSGYGIGLQYGTLKNVTLQNIVVEDTGSDGIDIKNRSDNNIDCKMDNITVRRAGLNTTLDAQTCIDIRGMWHLSNIDCNDFINNGSTAVCSTGIRFRIGELEEESGFGGHYSSLTNFRVKANSLTNTIGVNMGSRRCQVSNGVVQNCGLGYQVTDIENSLANCYAEGCNDGFYIDTAADRTILEGVIARGNTDSGIRVLAKRVVIDGIFFGNSVRGVNIRSTADYTIVSGSATSNTTNNLYNAGTNTKSSDLYT